MFQGTGTLVAVYLAILHRLMAPGQFQAIRRIGVNGCNTWFYVTVRHQRIQEAVAAYQPTSITIHIHICHSNRLIREHFTTEPIEDSPIAVVTISESC